MGKKAYTFDRKSAFTPRSVINGSCSTRHHCPTQQNTTRLEIGFPSTKKAQQQGRECSTAVQCKTERMQDSSLKLVSVVHLERLDTAYEKHRKIKILRISRRRNRIEIADAKRDASNVQCNNSCRRIASTDLWRQASDREFITGTVSDAPTLHPVPVARTRKSPITIVPYLRSRI